MEEKIPHSARCLMQALLRRKEFKPSTVRLFSDYCSGYFLRPDGKKKYFRFTQNDLNPVGAYCIAKYKHLTKEALLDIKVKVPDGVVIKRGDDVEEKLRDFHKLNKFPLIVKPASLSKGAGVQVVHNQSQLLGAIEKAKSMDSVVLVEDFIKGTDHRFVVFKDKVICVFSKTPDDEYKPSNISLGAKAVDVTGKVSQHFLDLAVRISKELNLTICGIDIKIEGDISDTKNERYCILEVNSAPDNSYFVKMGPKQEKIIQELYDEILNHLMI